MRFDYPEYFIVPSPAAPGRAFLYRPVIRVRMTGGKASRAIWTLLDTGADESYITESLAAKLGVIPVTDSLEAVASASGELMAWYGKLTLEVSDGQERHVLPITVGVVRQDWSEMILGHLGFFEYFDANFSDVDKTVELSRR
jgi:hypothetical protein